MTIQCVLSPFSRRMSWCKRSKYSATFLARQAENAGSLAGWLASQRERVAARAGRERGEDGRDFTPVRGWLWLWLAAVGSAISSMLEPARARAWSLSIT